LYLLLEAGDQFAVGGDQRLLGFDFGDDSLLCSEGRNRNFYLLQDARLDAVDRGATLPSKDDFSHAL